TDVDRLVLSGRPNGDYEAYITKRDCDTCETIFACPFTYEGGLVRKHSQALSVHPTYISAAEPYIYFSVTDGAGEYYLYGPAGRIVVKGHYAENSGEQKLQLPAMSGLYVLIFMPDGETNIGHVVQKVKLIVY
ncbi:MAG: hypothetical protein IJ882_05365, partial [Paludibacteraceae bacterium]|nr:hypothetical protein [Paludibacteraceae bacterium]